MVIGLVGKYTELHDTYLSVVKALLHASLHCNRRLTVKWIDSAKLDKNKMPSVGSGMKLFSVNNHVRENVCYVPSPCCASTAVPPDICLINLRVDVVGRHLKATTEDNFTQFQA